MDSKKKPVVKSKSAKSKKLTANVPSPQPGLAIDHTERKQVEEALRISEERYRLLVENANEAIFVAQDGMLRFVNRMAGDLTGYSEKELTSIPFPNFVHPDDRNNVVERHLRLLEGDIFQSKYAFRLITRDGSTKWVEIGTVLIDWEGKPATLNFLSDITARKRAEEKIRETQVLLKASIESPKDMIIFSIDQNYQYLFFSSVHENVMRVAYGKNVKIGMNQLDCITNDDDRRKAKINYDRALNGFNHVTIEEYGDLERDYYETRYNPIYNDNNEIIGATVFSVNITERKRAEEDIQSLAKFPAENPYPILRIGQDGTLLYINAAGSSQLPDWHLQVGQAVPPILKETVVKSIKNGTMQLIDLEYGERVYSFSVAPIVATDYTNLYGFDITERKQNEEALRESEKRLRFHVENSPMAVVEWDTNFMVTRWSGEAEKIFGWSREETIGKPIMELGLIYEEDIPIVQNLMQQLTDGITRRVVSINRNYTKDGKVIYCEWYNSVLQNPQGKMVSIMAQALDITESKQAEEALRNRESFLQKIFDILPVGLWLADKDGKLLRGNPAGVKIWGAEPKVSPLEYGVFKGRRLPSGEEVAPDDWALVHTIRDKVTIVDEMLEIDAFDGKKKTILNYTAPVLDAQGDVQGAIVVNQDITERKHAEKELAQSHEQLRALASYWQSTIEEERAHIAREIHDEFGQSMTALKMDLVWLANHLPEGDEKVDRIRGMTTLVDESVALMRRIATDLRPGLLDDLGLNAALEWQAQEFSRHSGIPCKLNLPEYDLGLDPALNTTLFRIFQETLTNIARHAQATHVNTSLKSKKQTLVLTIRDNGRGITEGELNNPRSLGLLGLRERATQWGGETIIHSVPGQGTTVTVRIPLPASPMNGGK